MAGPMNPSAQGRGPRHLYRWYEIKTTDGASIVARWVRFDASHPDRAEHVLTFEDDEFVHDIPYGEIVSCLPMDAHYRAAEIRDRAARDARRARQRRQRRRGGGTA